MKLRYFIALLVVSSLLLGGFGCAKPAPTPPKTSPAPAPAPSPAPPPTTAPPAPKPSPAPAPSPTPAKPSLPAVVTYATFPPGSMSYTFGVAISAAISKYTPMKCVVEPAPGTPVYFELLRTKKAESLMTNCFDLYNASRGLDIWVDKPDYSMLRQMSMTINFAEGFFTRDGTGINTIADLKGKKVGWPAQKIQPDMFYFANECVKAYGLDPEKDMTRVFIEAQQDVVSTMKEKRLDAVFWGITPFVDDIRLAVGYKPLAVDQEHGRKIHELTHGTLFWDKVPGKIMYLPGVESIGYTVAPFAWITADWVSEDVIYEEMKAIFEHVPELVAIHPRMDCYTLANALKSVVLPVHPGAIKYFKEKKAWTAELEAKSQAVLKEVQEAAKKKQK